MFLNLAVEGCCLPYFDNHEAYFSMERVILMNLWSNDKQSQQSLEAYASTLIAHDSGRMIGYEDSIDAPPKINNSFQFTDKDIILRSTTSFFNILLKKILC